MSLIKLAISNEYNPKHKDYKGFKTKEVWAGRGIGALAGGVIGHAAGGINGLGAGIGAGLLLGDIAAKTRSMYNTAKKEKYKHPVLRSLGNQAYLHSVEHTPVSSAFAQLDPGTALGGAIMRKMNEK